MAKKNQDLNRFFKAKSEQQVASWLLRGFASSDFQPIQISDEPSPAIQLQHVWEVLEPGIQERFKAAVVRATAEWNPTAHGPHVLTGLVFLSAYIQATQVIDVLRTIIESELLHTLEDKEYYRTTQTVIGALAGFAPLSDVRVFLERLYFSSSPDRRFAAQLFLALCDCQPKEWSKYVPKFMSLLSSFPQLYREDLVLAEFVRIVSLPEVINRLHQLDAMLGRPFLRSLCGKGDDSPVVPYCGPEGFFFRLRFGHNGSSVVPFPVPPEGLETEKDWSWDILFDIKMSDIRRRGGACKLVSHHLESMIEERGA